MAAVLRCYQCQQVVLPSGGQQVTMDSDGTYRRWTPERAAYFARYAQEAPRLVTLCAQCAALDLPEGWEPHGREG